MNRETFKEIYRMIADINALKWSVRRPHWIEGDDDFALDYNDFTLYPSGRIYHKHYLQPTSFFQRRKLKKLHRSILEEIQKFNLKNELKQKGCGLQ